MPVLLAPADTALLAGNPRAARAVSGRMRPALVATTVAAALVLTLGACGSPSAPEPSTGLPSIPLVGPQPLPSPDPKANANPARQPNGTFLWTAASARVLPGVVYRYTVFAHCGIRPTSFDFDGSFWDPVAEQTPPLGDPEDAGTIRLLGPDVALYTTARGAALGLRRAPDRTREVAPCD